MSGLRGVLLATIFVIRFFPQKLFGKIDWKIGWKICWKNCLENLLENLLENWLENLDGKFGWKCWLEKMFGKFGWKIVWKCWLENWLEKCVGKFVGKMCWKCWLNIWLEKMLVNGCEIIGEKIVATNLPLRLSTTLNPVRVGEVIITIFVGDA